MAFTTDQLIQSLSTAAKQQVKDVNGNMVQPIGEIKNALRDFRFNVDTNKINALSMDEWNRIAPEIGGGRAASERELRQQKDQLLSDTLSARTPLRRAAGAVQADGTVLLPPDGGTNEFNTAVQWANALEKYGLSSVSAADQFSKFGNFSAADQVAAERAAADPFGARAAQVAQRTGGEATVIDPKTFEIKGVNTGTVYGTGTSIADAIRQQTTMSTGSAPGAVSQVNVAETVSPSGDRKLGPGEFESLRKQLGVSEKNFDQYFKRDAAGNILLKGSPGGSDNFSVPDQQTFDATSMDKVSGGSFDSSFLSSMNNGANAPDAFISSIKSLMSLFDAKTTEQTRLEAERAKLTGDLTTEAAAASNMAAEQAALDKQYGIADKTKQLEDLNLRIAQKMGEYDAGEAKIMNQAIPAELLTGQAAALKRQQAVDVGMLTAQAAAIKDNLDLANSLVDRALTIKYQDTQNKIDATKAFLALNKESMTAEETKASKKIELLLSERTRVLDAQKEREKSISDLILEVAKAGGDTSKMSLDKTLTENANIASPYLLAAERRKAAVSAAKTDFTQTMSLRKEFQSLPEVKSFVELERSYTALQSALDAAKAAGNAGTSKAAADQALITVFNKMLDPGSVVREGEYARSVAGQSAINQLAGFRDRLASGGAGITDEDRTAMVSIAGTLFNDAQAVYNDRANFYTDIAKQGGIDPAQIVNSSNTTDNSLSGFLNPGSGDELDKLLDGAVGFSKDLGTSQNGLTSLKDSLVQQESGGNYKAVGSPTAYGSALGKYQIIPKFHFAKIGLQDTAADRAKFLNSPALQDELFGKIIQGLSDQYNGDPSKIAAAYYGGGGAASIVGTKDADKPQVAADGKTYPSINQYVNSVLKRAYG